jgi:hypothetical protein
MLRPARSEMRAKGTLDRQPQLTITRLTMSRRHIPTPVKELVVRMSYTMTPVEVAASTGINVRTVQRVRKLFEETGQVVRVPPHSGRPRDLGEEEGNVSSFILAVEPGPNLFSSS